MTSNLAEPVKQVEAYLEAYLSQRSLPVNLAAAMKYAVLGPGKRMRPILVIRSCEAVGGEATAAMAPAAAIEMIHAFSLVHDDLPAMDDDDLRRGRPTLHRHTNEAMAILAGDGLMGLAFELIVTRVKRPKLAMALLEELAVGTNDMVAGQVYDTLPDFPAEMAALDRLKLIHRHKTGALLRASCRMGAMCGGAGKRALAAVTKYGEAIGLMFQIVDDVLDVTQTTEHLGKTAGKDVAQEKLTYPAVMGLERSRKEIDKLAKTAEKALSSFGQAANPLRELCEYLATRTR